MEGVSKLSIMGRAHVVNPSIWEMEAEAGRCL